VGSPAGQGKAPRFQRRRQPRRAIDHAEKHRERPEEQGAYAQPQTGWRRLIPRDSIRGAHLRLSSRSTGKKWKPSAITKVASRTFTPTRAVGAMAQPRLRASSRGEVVRTRCAEATYNAAKSEQRQRRC